MRDPAVLYEVESGAAWLTINRPETRNALSQDVRDGLFDGIRRFNADDAATQRSHIWASMKPPA